MFQEGKLLKFSPFVFKNGARPKVKYYIVLKHLDEKVMMAVLPTSHDHIPSSLAVASGCVNSDERGINAFIFEEGKSVNGNFSFPKRTYVYGEQVDEYDQSYLEDMTTRIDDLGFLDPALFLALKRCLKQGMTIKRRYKKLL